MSRLVWWLVAVGCAGETKGSCDCDPASEYCVEFHSDIAGEPTSLSCEPLPECTGDACDCLTESEDVPYNFEVCTCTDGDLVQVVCPGG